MVGAGQAAGAKGPTLSNPSDLIHGHLQLDTGQVPHGYPPGIVIVL